jgi:hypothetical protein
VSVCPTCGAQVTAADRFCPRCGSAVGGAAGGAESTRTIPAPPADDTVLRNPFAGFVAAPPPVPVTSPPTRRIAPRVAVMWAAIGTAVVVAGATVAIAVAGSSSSPSPTVAPPLPVTGSTTSSAAVPAGSTPAPTAAPTTAQPRQATTTVVVVTTTTTKAAPTTPTTPTTPATRLMGGDDVAIACDPSGWVLQVASDTSLAGYRTRIAELARDGQLPAGTRWTQVSSGCAIFSPAAGTDPHNVYVLYTGPYGSVDEACADRLQAPPDAFVRSTDPSIRTDQTLSRHNCACSSFARPSLPGGGDLVTQDWTADLQNLLIGAGTGLSMTDLTGSVGEYDAATRSAVLRLQQGAGLPATGTVDDATWGAVTAAAC